MGTRSDYYIGVGENAEWLGSAAYDGYPETETLKGGIPEALTSATTEDAFREALKLVSARDDWTAPEQGWPWPWDDSGTTDYAYCFDASAARVIVVCFGKHEDESEASFPNMKDRKNVTFGKRSGVLIFRG